MYSRRKMQNFPHQHQTQLSQKWKAFSRFFIAFLKFTSSLEHFEKKMSLLAEVFPKILAPKEVDTQMSKRPYIRTRFGEQRVSGYEILLKSAQHNYYRIFRWIWVKLSCKKTVLVRSEILGHFVNTFTGEYMYSRRKMENFPHQLQAQLSQKWKAFSRFFIAFLKCTSTVENFEQKDEPFS